MSFTFDTSTVLGKLRAMIGDTDASSFDMSDEELNVFLGQTSNDLNSAAAMSCRAAASKYAKKAISKTAGNYSEDKRAISKMYSDMADKFESQATSAPAEAESEVINNDFQYNDVVRDRILRGESLDD